MKILTKAIIGCITWLLITGDTANAQTQVSLNVAQIPPISPILNQILSRTGSGIRVTLLNRAQPVNVAISGSLERISPAGFTMSTKKGIKPSRPIILPQMQALTLTSELLQQAYGNFESDFVDYTGLSLNDLRDGVNYKLPEGKYRMCFEVLRYDDLTPLSQRMCTMFDICYQAGAPQFTQPVNNISINASIPKINPRSPLVFTWTPPRAICGSVASALSSLRYDLEIREIMENQTVTDAVNNPYIFRKTVLPSTTFLLDTNLYRNVLQAGKRYITRVRATVMDRNSPVKIDNFGYSRIEAFQYGDNSVVQTNAPSSELFYIPFGERKTDFWDDAMTAFEKKERTDTVVPTKEYISLVLMRNGIVYSYDAIELILALNPDLYTSSGVKLSNAPKLPSLPVVPQSKRNTFSNEHINNLLPDATEEIKYKKNIDSFAVLMRTQSMADTTSRRLNTLLVQLNSFSQQTGTINRVSMNIMNDLLIELLYELRSSPQAVQNQPGQLENLISGLGELMTVSVSSTSSLFITPFKKRSSLSSFEAEKNPPVPLSYFLQMNKAQRLEYLPPVMDVLLSFDIIVYHYSKDQPPKPELNTGDLTATFKVLYTPSKLYNHKNPEINAKATTGPASTAQVSLPKTKYQFWTQSMFTNKQSKPQEVDLLDAFLHSKKRWPTPKNFSIVLKVN